MSNEVIKVTYPYLYDLYYRVKFACLEHECYAIDFLDWVKAGIAYNILGVKDPKRKVAYFDGIYSLLMTGNCVEERHVFQTAVMRFYEDLFQLYQDHLVAQMKQVAKKGKQSGCTPCDLILLPSFEKSGQLIEALPVIPVNLSTYTCKNTTAFRQRIATIYATEDSLLYKGMSMLFDYGVCREGNGILLGVSDFGYSAGTHRIQGTN